MDSLSLLAFSWNGQNQTFCREPSQSSCSPLDFWSALEAKIILIGPTVVVFGFQNTEIDFSSQMRRLDYFLFERVQASSCLLLIYLQENSRESFSSIETIVAGRSYHEKCGITKILLLPNQQTIGLTNISLADPKYLQDLLRPLVYSCQINSTLILASLNLPPQKCDLDESNCSDKLDLKKLRLKEGIDNQGHDFPPTCYLSRNRRGSQQNMKLLWPDNSTNSPQRELPNSHEVTESDYQVIGKAWCDRIFYGTFGNRLKLICLEYGRIDNPRTSIRNSDHAFVYGLYTF